MSRKLILRLAFYFLLLVVLQIPLLHNWVLYDVAFPFPYIGFILLMPHTLPKGWAITIAFFLGLLVDVFSNTPGIHASASVLIAYYRVSWLQVVSDTSNEEMDLTFLFFGFSKFTLFMLPLIFIHHTVIFVLENEGFNWAGALFSKVLWSTLFSYFLICLVTLLIVSNKRRK